MATFYLFCLSANDCKLKIECALPPIITVLLLLLLYFVLGICVDKRAYAREKEREQRSSEMSTLLTVRSQLAGRWFAGPQKVSWPFSCVRAKMMTTYETIGDDNDYDDDDDDDDDDETYDQSLLYYLLVSLTLCVLSCYSLSFLRIFCSLSNFDSLFYMF